jgi:hypothetical protein
MVTKSLQWLLAGALACAPALAHSAEWDRWMLIYVLGAGLDGKTQVGSVATDIDESFTDLLEHLDVGGMGTFRASNDTWAHTFDAIYTGLNGDETLRSGTRLEAEVDQLIASYDIAYRMGQYFEVLGGVRYTSIDVDLAAGTPAGTARASGDKDWFDPYIGAGLSYPFNDTFSLGMRADIGGFDVGSKLTWQAVVRATWNMTDTFFGSVGYRILATDYEDGSGAGRFIYDVTIQGPGIGFGWRFR